MDLIKKYRNPKYLKDFQERRKLLSKIRVTSLKGEYWIAVPSYEGHYEISNFARIKSIYRIVPKMNHTVAKPEQLLRPHKNSDGYYIVSLTKDTVSKTYSLHTIVAKVFVRNKFNLPEVNHKDGNKLNCLPSNLEWGTHKYNMRHAVETGLRKYSSENDCKRFKLTEQQILDIFASKEKSGELALKYNLTKSSIQRIRSGKTYSSVTKCGKSLKVAYNKITQKEADEIRGSSLTQKEICNKYCISKGLVYNIKNNISYNGLNKD